MHVDVNVGKQLSALGHTLTTLAAFEEEDESNSYQGNVLNNSQELHYSDDENPKRSLSQVKQKFFSYLLILCYTLYDEVLYYGH